MFYLSQNYVNGWDILQLFTSKKKKGVIILYHHQDGARQEEKSAELKKCQDL